MDRQITDSEASEASWSGISNSPSPSLTPLFDDSMPPPPEAEYSSQKELYSSIQEWAAQNGYAFTISRSKKIGLRTKVIYACDRRGKPTRTNQEQEEELQGNRRRKRRTGSRKTGCLFSVTAVEVSSTRWELRYREGITTVHNHPPSALESHPVHRKLKQEELNQVKLLQESGKLY